MDTDSISPQRRSAADAATKRKWKMEDKGAKSYDRKIDDRKMEETLKR
jgi:hypothetical protein